MRKKLFAQDVNNDGAISVADVLALLSSFGFGGL